MSIEQNLNKKPRYRAIKVLYGTIVVVAIIATIIWCRGDWSDMLILLWSILLLSNLIIVAFRYIFTGSGYKNNDDITYNVWITLAPIILIILWLIIWWIVNNINDYKEEKEYQKQIQIEEQKTKEEENKLKSVLEYTDFKWLYVKYPWYLSIDSDYDNDNETLSNITVSRKKYSELVSTCVNQITTSFLGTRESVDKEKRKMHTDNYNKTIDLVMSGSIPEDSLYYDFMSCGDTKWPISAKIIKVGDYNALYANNYYTQDSNLWCIESMNSSLFLPVDKETVYYITFKNNFGDSQEFINNNLDWYWCYSSNYALWEFYSNELIDYFRKWIKPSSNELLPFIENDKLFQKISQKIEYRKSRI